MVARQSGLINGTSTSNGRRGRTQEREAESSSNTKLERQNGHESMKQQHPPPPPIDDESDVDELVDSESERAEMAVIAKTKAASTSTSSGKTATNRVKGRTSAGGAGASSSGTKNTTNRGHASLSDKRRSEGQESPNDAPVPLDKNSSTSVQKSSPPESAERAGNRSGTLDSSKVSAFSVTPASSSSRGPAPPSQPASEVKSQGSPRQGVGRSATGRPVPYYYPQPTQSNTSQSQRDDQSKRNMSSFATTQLKTDAGKGSNNSEHLTMQEVDQFLDLIEKHNLHTSNEDDMARSVTELYQEWLEWCAKRNVQSTKSKQALVAEFVRIHQGEYGHPRQQRAMEIVKGSSGSPGSAIVEGNDARLANEPANQSSIPFLPPSKSAPSLRATSRYKEEDRERAGHHVKSLSASTGSKRVTSGSSHYNPIPSPSIAPRALTPSPTNAFNNNGHSLSSSQAQSDTLSRQLRDDVWRDAKAMINRVIHEQMAEIIEENSALRGRVEQLEIHSDNLAQWIQHLNRVQDELGQSVQSTAVPLRGEETMVEEPSGKFTTHANSRQMMPPTHERNYAPSYHVNPPSQPSSPKRLYGIRRSPSPPIMTHHSSSAPRRPNGSPHLQSHQPMSSTTYRDHSRDTRDFYSGGSSHGHSNRIPLSDPYDRPYYSYPIPDDRDPPPPLPRSPRQIKRARNGY